MKNFWSDGRRIGLTKEALKELGVIWQFIPRVMEGSKVYEGQGIATVQTSSEVKSLVSPRKGVIFALNAEAVERPNCINEATVLFVFCEENALPLV